MDADEIARKIDLTAKDWELLSQISSWWEEVGEKVTFSLYGITPIKDGDLIISNVDGFFNEDWEVVGKESSPKTKDIVVDPEKLEEEWRIMDEQVMVNDKEAEEALEDLFKDEDDDYPEDDDDGLDW